MRSRRALFISLVLSLVLHVAFLFYSSRLDLPETGTNPFQKEKVIRVRNFERELPDISDRKKFDPQELSRKLKFQKPDQAHFDFMNFEKQLEMEIKKALTPEQEKVKKLAKINERETVEKDLKSEEAGDLRQRTVRRTRADLYNFAESPENEQYRTPDEALSPSEAAFYEKMPGFTPKLSQGTADYRPQTVMDSITKSFSSLVKRKTERKSLEEYLVGEIYTYEDPEDGQKYFQISVRVGPRAEALPTLPKEIIYLVDCSLSTERKRLRQFKKGIRHALQNLNPDDRFNIYAFKKRITKLSEQSLGPSVRNIRAALRFVDELTLGEKTDAYNALYNSITTDDPFNPSYLIFLSDGRPTQGVIEPRKLINDISRVNDGRMSIFAFSGGLYVNRYLLDFISYKNRGWTEYSYRTHFIGKNMARMYEKIKDPLMLNLKYRVSGLDESVIFPRLLPDFFRNTEFTMYGTYDEENEFAFQLVGEIQGEQTEFTFEGDLSNAAAGDKEIAKNWAFNKIYHLIGQLEYDRDNTELLGEIDALSRRFDIRTPYLENIN